MGCICEKHERFVRDDEECPYCEPEGLFGGIDRSVFSFWRPTVTTVMTMGELAKMMNDAMEAMINAPYREPVELHSPQCAAVSGGECNCVSFYYA